MKTSMESRFYLEEKLYTQIPKKQQQIEKKQT